MKLHTTNSSNTFIIVAEDSQANTGQIPPVKTEKRTVADLQFEMLIKNPYKYTSDEVLFHVFAIRKNISPQDYEAAKIGFFSKGQPCFRASPLTKRYGWGVHSDENSKVAIFGCETTDYAKIANDKHIKVVKAMRSQRT